MAIKKSKIYSSLWASCDELRGGMDASQYKDYVLFMLFIKYISDKYANSDDFAPPITIPAGASFEDMVKLKGKPDIGDKINKQIIQALIDSNSKSLARTEFPDFNDPKKLGEADEIVERLSNLVGIFESKDLDFSKNRAEDDDILGDAYEYLMRHFATESGKSKGQFYTPAEVSRVIAKVIGISTANTTGSTTAYDPTCGSGSLLLKVAAEASTRITLEGQEGDTTTAGLARMNMILHNFPTAQIESGNTLTSPKFKEGENLRTYDYVVANPPFSDKKWITGLKPDKDPYQRFGWGVPPNKQGDYAYLLHIIRSMRPKGKGACILPHGVLFRGGAEAVIRKELVKSGYLKGIIGLPSNLFYGTGIPACILVLDKDNAPARKGIFMMDASKGFIKDGNKNRLRERDIHRIVDIFTQVQDVPSYARMVSFEEISNPKNDYNLNLPRYIDSADAEDIHNIEAHLSGGIPNADIDGLDAYWQAFPEIRKALFTSSDRANFSNLLLPIEQIKSGILEHKEFIGFRTKLNKSFEGWSKKYIPLLKGFGKDAKPKELIFTLSESLLAKFKPAPLVDAYALYQELMDYWEEIIQDDAYTLASDGWVALPQDVFDKGKYKGWECDLVPKTYVVARYFSEQESDIKALQVELENVENQRKNLEDEYDGIDGAFNESKKIDKTKVKNHIKEIGDSPDYVEEKNILSEWLELYDELAKLKKWYKNIQKTLEIEKDYRLKVEDIETRRERLEEYDDGEIDVFSEVKKIDKAAIKRRIKEIGNNLDFKEELCILKEWIKLEEKQTKLRKSIKDASKKLDDDAKAKYATLTEDEVKTLVVDDKWMPVFEGHLQAELEAISQRLTTRIKELAERYATPLPILEQNVDACSKRVVEHLRAMGLSWN